jgi:hypothetical protein
MDNNLDNLLISKVWEDETIFELQIEVCSQYVNAHQTCYFNEDLLNKLSSFLTEFCKSENPATYFESGHKTGKYTPAFSLALSSDRRGHVTIGVDLEICDVDDRSHRCQCNVRCELGALERFGKRLVKLNEGEIGSRIALYET